jgi:hypothetical protein
MDMNRNKVSKEVIINCVWKRRNALMLLMGNFLANDHLKDPREMGGE